MGNIFFYIPFSWSDATSDLYVQGSSECDLPALLHTASINKIDSNTICEMHNHSPEYVDVGECVLLASKEAVITVAAIIRKPNTILKIQEKCLLGFSLKFNTEQQRIVEISVIDAPTFQNDEDIIVQKENDLSCDTFENFDSFTSLAEFERHLESFLNREVCSERLEKVRVDRILNLRIEIRLNEHSPPHFHVCGDGIDASFSIEDGSLIAGHLRPKHNSLVRSWYKRSKPKLIEVWNSTRPGDCSVGPIS